MLVSISFQLGELWTTLYHSRFLLLRARETTWFCQIATYSHSNFGIQGWRIHVMTKSCSEFRNTEWMHTSLLTMSSPLQIENWKTDVSEMIIKVSRPGPVDKSISRLFVLTLQALGVHSPGWKSDLQKLWEKLRQQHSCLMIFLPHS